MAKKYLVALWLVSVLSLFGGAWSVAQDDSRIRVNVVLVQLNVAVTDHKGNYVTGLKPEDFQVLEDKIPETIATFEEGNDVTPLPATGSNEIAENDAPKASNALLTSKTATATPSTASATTPSIFTGSNVFILFDTSNYMYRGFVFAQDAIAEFIRSLEGVSKLAFYSYSRDLSRSAPLTTDRTAVLRGVRSSVAGDDAALYNCLLLTVKDAAQLKGRKVIVVFSNGPDNASSVPPEDVAELAQSTGTIIYMISTEQAQNEPVSTAVFERMSKATGGRAYFARSWKDEREAFASIRDDLAHLYTLSYYPQPNPNRGWRTISVKLVGKNAKYHLRTRDGYRLLQTTQLSSGNIAETGGSQTTSQR